MAEIYLFCVIQKIGAVKPNLAGMKNLLLPLCLLLLLKVYPQATLQEKLGYTKNAKLLILHADDLGVSHSENAASEYALEHGTVPLVPRNCSFRAVASAD